MFDTELWRSGPPWAEGLVADPPVHWRNSGAAMNWEAVGAAAELLGAIGVIASLLYLATQIRQSTRTARDTALRAMVTGVNHQLHEMLKPNNSAVRVL